MGGEGLNEYKFRMLYPLNKKTYSIFFLSTFLLILFVDNFCPLFGSFTFAEQSAEDHYKSGISYVQQRKYAEAMREFEEAIKLKTDYAEAYHSLGPLYYLQDKPEEAVHAVKQAIRLKPNYPEAYNTLGSIYATQNKPVEATLAFMEALRIKPDYIEALVNLGWMHYSQGKLDEAIQELKKASQLNPDHFDAHFVLALTYHQNQLHSKAVQEFKEASRIQPNHVETHQYLGTLYNLQGNHEEAVREFREVIKLGTEDAPAYNDLAWLLIDKDLNLDEGIEMAFKALQIGPNYVAAMRTLAWGYYKKGRYQESVDWFQKALEKLPQDKELQEGLEQARQKLQR